MIRFVVIAEVPPSRAEEWSTWMCQHHIPAVLATGCFERAVLWQEAACDASIVFLVEYWCPDEPTFRRYQEQHAPALRCEHAERFGNSVQLRRLLLAQRCTIELPTPPATP